MYNVDQDKDRVYESEQITENRFIDELKDELSKKERHYHEQKVKVEDLLNHRHIVKEGWNCNSSDSNEILERELRNLI